MNKMRRSQLYDILQNLNGAATALKGVLVRERIACIRTPENLQYSKNAEKREDCLEALEEAEDYLDDALDAIENCIHCVEAAVKQ